MSGVVDRLWYGKGQPLWPLWPLAWLYRSIARSRRRRALATAVQPLPVPVVVVGNITAGGTGKSPLTAWLVETLRSLGWQPVIITRGYGGRSRHYPLQATSTSDPALAGDEPVMLAQATGAPVVVDPDRLRGAEWALAQQLGNILVCDDGLQHYRLPRDIEIAVFDAGRGLGNGAPIPVGPLREPVSRLEQVDFVVFNGNGHPEFARRLVADHCYTMLLQPARLRDLGTGEELPVERLAGARVRAVAGIGNPGRFFDTLAKLGARVRGRSFGDHHHFTPADLEREEGEWLVMTAKDAVKCHAIAPPQTLVLEVSAHLQEGFTQALEEKLAGVMAAATTY